MRGVVHDGGNSLRQHPRFSVVMNAFNLDVFKIRPVRCLETSRMAQIVKLHTRIIFEILIHTGAPFSKLTDRRQEQRMRTLSLTTASHLYHFMVNLYCIPVYVVRQDQARSAPQI